MPLTFSLLFTSRKSSEFRKRRQVACEMFISKAIRRPRRKNCISGSIWHKSFIKMVKYSFPEERIVYQSFLNITIISKRLRSWQTTRSALCKDVQHTCLPIPNTEHDLAKQRSRPRLCERRTAKIELLPSAFKPFLQWSEIVCIVLNTCRCFLSFLNRKRSKIILPFVFAVNMVLNLSIAD